MNRLLLAISKFKIRGSRHICTIFWWVGFLLCSGSLSAQLQGGGGAVTYQWETRIGENGQWTAIPHQNGAILEAPPVSDSATYYRRKVTTQDQTAYSGEAVIYNGGGARISTYSDMTGFGVGHTNSSGSFNILSGPAGGSSGVNTSQTTSGVGNMGGTVTSQNQQVQYSHPEEMLGTDMHLPIDAGTFSDGFVFTDMQDTSDPKFWNRMAQEGSDVYYSFTLEEEMTVAIHGFGSDFPRDGVAICLGKYEDHGYGEEMNILLVSIDSWQYMDAMSNEYEWLPETHYWVYGQHACIYTVLGPGKYMVSSDGYRVRNYGKFNSEIRTTIRGMPTRKGSPQSLLHPGQDPAQAIDLGTLIVGSVLQDNADLTKYWNLHSGDGNDVYYKFSMDHPYNFDVNVSVADDYASVSLYHIVESEPYFLPFGFTEGTGAGHAEARLNMMLIPGQYIMVCRGAAALAEELLVDIQVTLGKEFSEENIVLPLLIPTTPNRLHIENATYDYTYTMQRQVNGTWEYARMIEPGGAFYYNQNSVQLYRVMAMWEGTRFAGYSNAVVVGKTVGNNITDITYTGSSADKYDDAIVNITYYDGLSRPSQSIGLSASLSGKDIVSNSTYDCMGRADAESYMPFVADQSSGVFITNPLEKQQKFYSDMFPGDADRNYAFSQKEYGPAGLVMSQTGPGENGAAHPAKFAYRLNDGFEGIKKLSVDADGNLVVGVPYVADRLTVAESWQELPDDPQVHAFEYKNPLGQLVAKEVRTDTDRRISYYVYDDMGRQRYIIPPIYSESLPSTPTALSYESMKHYCYYMEYDEWGRVIKQCVPGAEPSYSIYDERGRLAMTQTGNQHEAGQWAYTKYDDQNRPVMTGITISTLEPAQLRDVFKAQTVFGETRTTGGIHGYTNNTYPIVASEDEILSVNYYDDYEWQTGTAHAFRSDEALGGEKSEAIVGLVTGSKIKILDPQATTVQWLTSAVYYDDKYRTIQTVADLWPLGSGVEVVSNTHNFVGEVTQTRVTQTTPDG
jgi:hypothetical protein